MRDESIANPLESQLSAFLDGELPENETELLIRRLERDGSLQKALARYALMGEVMRTPAGAQSVTASRGFAARVAAAIAADAAPSSEAQAWAPAMPRWLKPAAGFSISAGVAVLAISVLTTEPESLAVATADTSDTSAPTTEASFIVPEITVTGPLMPAARLTNYVMAHSAYSSPLGQRNVLSGMLADEMGPDVTIPSGFLPTEPAPAPMVAP